MKLFADECVYQVTVALLREWGYDVVTVQEVSLSGKSDEEILAYAVRHERVLITIDMDFSNIRHYPPNSHHGIIVIKIRPRVATKTHAVLEHLLKTESPEKLQQSLVIVDQSKFRIR